MQFYYPQEDQIEEEAFAGSHWYQIRAEKGAIEVYVI